MRKVLRLLFFQLIFFLKFISITKSELTHCKLAQELYFQHGVALSDIPTWICIAEEESKLKPNSKNRDTYGLFRISSRYWCSEDLYNFDKACKMPCSFLLDNQLTDDVQCALTIYNETAKIKESGFSAWNSYKKCQMNARQYTEIVESCFAGIHLKYSKLIPRSKAYKPCELAQELYQFHRVPFEEVASFVCVAFHESRLVTSSQLDENGHGLFQFQERWWCKNGDGMAKECDSTCDEFRDIELSDDVACAMKVKQRHGFSGWSTFNKYCSKEVVEKMLKGCNYGTPFRPKVFEASVATKVPQNFLSSTMVPFYSRFGPTPNITYVKKVKRKCWSKKYLQQKKLSLEYEEECFRESINSL